MSDVPRAAPDRPAVPTVQYIEHERRVHGNRGMQTGRRLPRAEPDARHEFADGARRAQRNPAAVAGHDVPPVRQPSHLDLHAFQRRIHVSGRPAADNLLAEHVPGFDGLSQFDIDALSGDLTDHRKSEFEVRGKPLTFKRISGRPHLVEHLVEVRRHEMGQHEAIVNGGSPSHETLTIGCSPEPRNQRPQQQLLREAHARMRGHLERPQFDEPQPARCRVGREELVDAELGPVRVPRGIGQQMAKHPVDKPWGNRSLVGDLLKGDFQFVQTLRSGFIHARRLAGRADKQP